jgi:hypothetical protein
MFSTFRTTAISAAALALAAGFAAPAEATFIFTMEEVGNDVVVDGSGSINTTGEPLSTVDTHAQLRANFNILVGGPASLTPIETFQYTNGPPNFGTGGIIFQPNTTSGDAAGVFANVIDVPSGYMSGANLSDTMTFAGKTFATLGVIPGTYTYTWGTGVNADSLILEIGVVPAPEPSTLALLAMGLAGLGMVVRRRHA